MTPRSDGSKSEILADNGITTNAKAAQHIESLSLPLSISVIAIFFCFCFFFARIESN